MKLKNIFFSLILITMMAMPFVSSAQATESGDCAIKEKRTVACLAGDIINLINKTIVPLIMAAAFAALIYGISIYIFQGGNETKRKEGIKFITWSLVALFLMFAIWGIVNLLLNTFNLNLVQPKLPDVKLPQLP